MSETKKTPTIDERLTGLKEQLLESTQLVYKLNGAIEILELMKKDENQPKK